jgi:hypothetical protein
LPHLAKELLKQKKIMEGSNNLEYKLMRKIISK